MSPETPSDDAARFERAVGELHAAITDSRSALAAARASQTLGVTERLQADASAGRLGPELRELAGLVASGRTSWDEVFSGDSAYGALIGPHLGRMADRHAAAAARHLAEDPDGSGQDS